MFPVSGTVRATGHVGSRPGTATGVSVPTRRARSSRIAPTVTACSVPGRSSSAAGKISASCTSPAELPELPGVERFPEGPRLLPGLLQDGAVGDGPAAGEFGTRELGRLQVQGEQLEAQGDELRTAEGEGAGVVRGDRSPAAGGRSGGGGSTRSGRGMSCRGPARQEAAVEEGPGRSSWEAAELRPGQEIGTKRISLVRTRGADQGLQRALSVDGKSHSGCST